MERILMTEEEEFDFISALESLDTFELELRAAYHLKRVRYIIPFWINDETDMGTRDEAARQLFQGIDRLTVCTEMIAARRSVQDGLGDAKAP